MANDRMMAQVCEKRGFFAALDQSGGSTPGGLRLYGVPDSAYSDDVGMFKLIHEMRMRIITAPAFTGDRIIGEILFEATIDGQAEGKPVPAFLWEERGVVTFLKVDKGLHPEADGVQLMKPVPGLDAVLERAATLGIFGTKMRSVIHRNSPTGIAAIVKQQFELSAQIESHGLMPILEAEVLITCPDKASAEATLCSELSKGLDALPSSSRVMLKLTLPEVADFYRPLIEHPRVARVVALSGGYSRSAACERLASNQGMVGSFSRALINDLRKPMSDNQFNAALEAAVEEIYRASVEKI
ncbi:fructose bisphosphate aldolase [Paraburkholderia strydomiana]|uniref:fructose bisphosphate aldolase n=1 Tax=Paraburkholderia strydomiana TaxID=1245417 RepID=UPI001BE55218|nr:fructose bisphosphate aldolase [Paraburkholderia strydomiana]MBT2794953.1 fructose bisphosphate aldolase [Paraburkholderia strydomiana]